LEQGLLLFGGWKLLKPLSSIKYNQIYSPKEGLILHDLSKYHPEIQKITYSVNNWYINYLWCYLWWLYGA